MPREAPVTTTTLPPSPEPELDVHCIRRFFQGWKPVPDSSDANEHFTVPSHLRGQMTLVEGGTMDTVDIDTPTPAAEPPAPAAPTAPITEIDRRSLFRRPLGAVVAAVGGGLVLAGCDFTSASFDHRIHLLKRLTYGATPRIAIGSHRSARTRGSPSSSPRRPSTPPRSTPSSPSSRRSGWSPSSCSTPTRAGATRTPRHSSSSPRCSARWRARRSCRSGWSSSGRITSTLRSRTGRSPSTRSSRIASRSGRRARSVQGSAGCVRDEPGDAPLPRQLRLEGRRDQRELWAGAARAPHRRGGELHGSGCGCHGAPAQWMVDRQHHASVQVQAREERSGAGHDHGLDPAGWGRSVRARRRVPAVARDATQLRPVHLREDRPALRQRSPGSGARGRDGRSLARERQCDGARDPGDGRPPGLRRRRRPEVPPPVGLRSVSRCARSTPRSSRRPT